VLRPLAILLPALLLGLTLVPSPAEAAPPTKDDVQEARILSEQGLQFLMAKDFGPAAKLYHRAFGLDPDPDYLYGAARAEHQGGLLDDAGRDYARVLELVSDKRSPRYVKSAAYLAEVKAGLAKRAADKPRAPADLAPKADPQPAPKPDPVPTPSTPPSPNVKSALNPELPRSTWMKPIGIASLGLGVAALVASGIVVKGAMADQADLDKKVSAAGTTTDSSVPGQQEDINARLVMGWIFGGVGLGLAAGGAVLWALAPSASKTASVTPIPGGAMLTLWF